VFFIVDSFFALVSCRDNDCDGKIHERSSAQLSKEFPGFIPYQLGDTLVLKDSADIRSTFVCEERSIRTDTFKHDYYDNNSNICYVEKYIQNHLTVKLRQIQSGGLIELDAYTENNRGRLEDNIFQYNCWYDISSYVSFNFFTDPCNRAERLSCLDTLTVNGKPYRDVLLLGKGAKWDDLQYVYYHKDAGLLKLKNSKGKVWEKAN